MEFGFRELRDSRRSELRIRKSAVCVNAVMGMLRWCARKLFSQVEDTGRDLLWSWAESWSLGFAMDYGFSSSNLVKRQAVEVRFVVRKAVK